MLEKQIKRQRRHRRVRAKIFGTAQRPRFCVFKSASHVYAQLINDEKGKTLLAVSDLSLKKEKKSKTEKIPPVEGEKALTIKVAESYQIGKLIAEKAIEQKIKKVVFDRGGYKYHGIVKSLADGARKGGLEF